MCARCVDKITDHRHVLETCRLTRMTLTLTNRWTVDSYPDSMVLGLELGTGDTGNSVALELKTMRFDSSLATITN